MGQYETDFFSWTQETAAMIRDGRVNEVDWDNLAEEIESLGKSERRALSSFLLILIQHLLKWRYQPGLRSPSWSGSIRNSRFRINRLLKDSPSLRQAVPEFITDAYPTARANALEETGLTEETFPQACPFSQDEVLDEGFFPK